jgi:Beta-1,4-xylanase
MIRFRTALVIVLFGTAAGHAIATQPSDALKDAYRNDFMIGAAVNPAIVSGREREQQALVQKHFNSITAEHWMKFSAIHPSPNRWNFEHADAFVEFGRANNMFIVGHTLIWHQRTPDWFFKDGQGGQLPSDQLASRMRDYIKKVAGRYKGKIHAWDVVNEQIDDDGNYRHDSPWVKGIGNGDKLVRLAFTYAHEYAPDAELYYNDFNTWKPKKVASILRMVRMLRANGIRIDGIGEQGHWRLESPNLLDIQSAIDAYAAEGLKVMITEMDIDVLPEPDKQMARKLRMLDADFRLPEHLQHLDPYQTGPSEDLDIRLAERYAELFELFHKNRDKIDRVTLWGVSDSMSWRNNKPIWGRTNYPLLFDRHNAPKPAMLEVLKAPHRGVVAPP